VAWAQARLAAEEFIHWGFAALALKLKRTITEWLQANVREDDDWKITQHSSCACMDCHQLNIFLASKTQRQLTWPLAKQRRQHMHNKIDGLRLPVTHITQRDGSPQKLVLTKMPELFTRYAKQVAQFSQSLLQLNAVLP
jgi:hypothetical protein